MREFSREAIEQRRKRHNEAMMIRWVIYGVVFWVLVFAAAGMMGAAAWIAWKAGWL